MTVENASNCVVPEDVELRLVSQSKGITKATPAMHKCAPHFSVMPHIGARFNGFTLVTGFLAP